MRAVSGTRLACKAGSISVQRISRFWLWLWLNSEVLRAGVAQNAMAETSTGWPGWNPAAVSTSIGMAVLRLSWMRKGQSLFMSGLSSELTVTVYLTEGLSTLVTST